MQQTEHPEISGTEYQRGTLDGDEVREYLPEGAGGRTCAYCKAENLLLQHPVGGRSGPGGSPQGLSASPAGDGYGYSFCKIAEKGEAGSALSLPGFNGVSRARE